MQPPTLQESAAAGAAEPGESGELLEATLFKGTTLPHIVVRRRCQLSPAGFVTYQIDKSPSSGKIWHLHRRTTLEPGAASLIRAHERHLRKAGPLRALSAYARDKNVLKLYCFRVDWPDKYAPSHGSSVELGFETLAQAQQWHEHIAASVTALGGSGGGGGLARQYSQSHSHNNSLSGGGGGGGFASVDPSPFTSPVSSFPSTPNMLSKQPSLVSMADGFVPAPALARDDANGGAAAFLGAQGHQKHESGSSHDSPLLGAAAAAGAGGTADGHAAAAALATEACSARPQLRLPQQQAYTRPVSSTGVVVDERMMRWVPYKHANGMAIYYRQTPQEEGRGMPQASGEYMLSTAVQASPECCVANLMPKADKNGSVLSTAAFMEVLEDNGEMQVWHMVFHPAGNAGLATVLAAPRYTFMHQVLTSYEEGVYAVLFSSVPDEDVKPDWVQRANARTQRAHSAVLRSDPGSGSRKALWRTPVRCRITGAITLSALEGYTGRNSPQTLVTCIVRADFGGWLSSKSVFCGLGQALGLQEALMDRVLMRVMILKEDVEYSRFKTKPFQLLMVQQEEDEGGGTRRQQQQQQQQQQQGMQRFAAAPTPSPAPAHAPAPAPAPVQQPGAEALQRTPGGAPAARQGSGCAPSAPAASPSAADIMARTQSAAGAVAVAAAARVSAAASALAAHMTNPQQLWHEKRGSTSGYGGSGATPPASPTKQSLAGCIGAGAAGAAKAPDDPGQQQQPWPPRIQVSAADGSGPACGPPPPAATAAASGAAAAAAAASAHPDRFFSLTGSSGGAAAAAAAADGGAGGDQQQQQQQQQQAPPFSEEQLEALVGGSLSRAYWEPIHDGVGSVRDVYSIRGPNYLRDRKKVPAGRGRYRLMAADLVATDGMIDHIGRFLPSVRCSGAAFSFVVDLVINYGSPVLHLVMVFSTDRHPNSLGPCPDDPLDAGEEWDPFDFTMSRFLHGTDEERNGMFKLIPHCAKGSWVVSQSVGTTPVILGRKLATTYHLCDRYVEVDVDVASTQAVAYIVKMVQGATRSMLIDHAYLLESQFAHELPEQLIGAIRYKHLDMTDYTYIPVDQELPFTPVVPGIVGQ